ncbi:MAG: histidine kinase [Phormidesmis priestleyi]|uniref:histidine kinase n=1 Tax=Phormidesmis priestleyi TaxID=268141 RepID=A0A2W4Z980_9CYAN|nr:MAG: histidine kinase [Phormidesmis priestleyi]
MPSPTLPTEASESVELRPSKAYSQDITLLQDQSEVEKKVLARQKALITLSNQIRRSLNFSTICQTATGQARQLLSADRVAIYRFNPDWSGNFISESVDSPWISLLEAQKHSALISKNVSDCSVQMLDKTKTTDTHMQVTYGGAFVQGEIFRVCTNIHTAGFSDCYIEVLESYQARAYAIIAIYVDSRLWGLLAAYQNSAPRQWHESDVQLLIQVAEQLGIALKQAEYVKTIQSQSTELQQALKSLQKSQAQLVQTEKMTSLGQLVAGIAHEINNPITFIYANLPYVKDYVTDLLTLAQVQALPADSKAEFEFMLKDLPKMLLSMQTGADRIRKIVLSLRNFSRLDESSLKTIDLHEGIESTLVVLSHQLAVTSKHAKIEVIKTFGDLPSVECYPAQINQVIWNIVSNAIDSLSAACDLKLSDADHLDSWLDSWSPKLWICTQMNEPSQVEICIRDNGVGIDESIRPKVFDYFFTTKPVGEGNGLGLAIAYQIIQDHGGNLSLNPDYRQGAELVIQLPIQLRSELGSEPGSEFGLELA